jgi:hypothetical protein
MEVQMETIRYGRRSRFATAIGLAAVAATLALAAPISNANAHDGWGRGHPRYHRGPVVIVRPPVFFAPPPVVYAPPPPRYIYAPAPVYVAPPPYYAPPLINFSFSGRF